MSRQEDWRKGAQTRYKQRLIGNKRFTLSEGANSIRVLPRKNPNGSFGGYPYQEYRKHWNVGPDEKMVICGKDIKGEGECWLCDVQLPKLLKSDKREARARAAAMAAKDVFAVQIAYLDEDNKFQGPVIWEAPQRVANDLMPWLFSTKRDFTSFSKGYNFTIQRTGTKKKNTNYGSVRPDEDPTPVSKSIVEKMKPFEEMVFDYDARRQQAAYMGREIEEELEEPAGDDYENVGDDGEKNLDEPQPDDFQQDGLVGDDENPDGGAKEDFTASEGGDDLPFADDAAFDDGLGDEPPPRREQQRRQPPSPQRGSANRQLERQSQSQLQSQSQSQNRRPQNQPSRQQPQKGNQAKTPNKGAKRK